MIGVTDHENLKMNKTDKTDKTILVAGTTSSKTSVLQRLLESASDEENSNIPNIHYIDEPLPRMNNTKERKFLMNCRHIGASIMMLPPQPLLRMPLIGDQSVVDSKVEEYNQIVDNYNKQQKII